jgi:hypothetical protein
VQHWLDKALLQVDAYAEHREDARDVCEAAIVALMDMPQSHALGVVSDVEDVIGPRQLPDTIGHRRRFEGEVLLTTHPAPEGS